MKRPLKLSEQTPSDKQEVNVWQDMFTSIIEDADANILLLDEDFRVVNLNSGFFWIFYETYGIELRKGNLLLESLEQKNPELTREWKERCILALSGTPIKVEDVFEIDGRNYYWEIHFMSRARPDGSQLISVFSRDITVRKAYQKKIVQNEANLRSIFNTVDDSIWLINTDLELIDFNTQFQKIHKQAFGVRPIRGVNVLSLLPSGDASLIDKWRDRYKAGLAGKPGKFHEVFQGEKELRNLEIKTYPIVENGVVTGVTAYARDITQQVRTEVLLKSQNEELTKINSELDRFVYSASHDLRAPLMSVKGLLNMINMDPEKEHAPKYLELIDQSIDKLDHFITDIILYSRNSRMEVKLKQIDFDALLDESFEALKYMEGASSLTITKDVDVIEPFESDASRLSIILNNIIANAVRYRDTRKASRLHVRIRSGSDHAELQFADNGLGIAEEHLESIFRMFFRASADSKGSGLGLYIVKGVVEKLAGTIRVESTVGVGTTFTILLPHIALKAGQ
ncbi:PAS domain-containing sensor histidine kinase [Chryseolinea sp. T2]|uniref:sensor histidine kinase n=1 Tax=Chryseolinea sp. T2 TaxID=3129255 RepID=UPI0030786206